MKNSSKIIIALTSIAAVGGGLYLFTRKKDQAPAAATSSNPQLVSADPGVKEKPQRFTGNTLVDDVIAGVFDEIGVDPVFTTTEPIVPVGNGGTRPLPPLLNINTGSLTAQSPAANAPGQSASNLFLQENESNTAADNETTGSLVFDRILNDSLF